MITITKEHKVGDRFIDGLEGKEVIVIADTCKTGCKLCAFSAHCGGACPGAVYDRHPCCASDREDGREVYFKFIRYVPEAKEPPLIMPDFGSLYFPKSIY